jgi:hypothetical protein
MSTIPQDVLESWPELWRLPPLWARVQRGETTIAPAEMVQYVCEGILEPLSSSDALLKLLSLGEFAAAEQFLSKAELQGTLESQHSDVFAQRLREARAGALRRIEERGYLLRERSRRLALDSTRVEQTIARAREAVLARVAEAADLLQDLESGLAELESRRADELQAVLQGRLSTTGRSAAWAESVRSAILSRDFPLALFLLDADTDGGTPELPVPWRRNWPFGRYPDRVIVQWFRGQGEGIPPTFAWRWGVPAGDGNGARLLTALDPLVTTPDAVEGKQVGSFLAAVGGCLGVPVEEPTAVSARDGAYWGRVQGLRRPGFYAFSAPVYDRGVVFLVPSPRAGSEGAEAELARAEAAAASGLPVSAEEFEQQPEDHASHEREEIYVYLNGYAGWPSAHGVKLDFITLFRLLSDESRAHNLLREVGTRLPLASGFPGPFPRNDGGFVVGREQEQRALANPTGPVLWLGPPGSGRSALLSWAARNALEFGWGVIQLGTAYGPGGLDEALARELSRQVPAWDPASGIGVWLDLSQHSGVLIVVDNADHLPEPGFRDTVAILSSLQSAGDGRVRCLATALPQLGGSLPEPVRAGAQRISPYLDFAHARKVIATIGDYLGLQFDPVTALDRLVYLSGGHIGLLHLLFWELLLILGEREPGALVPVSPAAVDRAFQSGSLRAWLVNVLSLLRSSTASAPDRLRSGLLRAALASMLLECKGARGTTVSMLKAWPELFDIHLDDAELLHVLHLLTELGLVVQDGDEWKLPPAGVQMLIAEVVGDPDTFLEEAAEDLLDLLSSERPLEMRGGA